MATEVLNHEQGIGEEPAAESSSTTALAVEGMSCNNCARHVREAIEGVAGVRNASVNLEAKRAVIHWSPGAPHSSDSIIQAVTHAGYQARVLDQAALSSEQ